MVAQGASTSKLPVEADFSAVGADDMTPSIASTPRWFSVPEYPGVAFGHLWVPATKTNGTDK